MAVSGQIETGEIGRRQDNSQSEQAFGFNLKERLWRNITGVSLRQRLKTDHFLPTRTTLSTSPLLLSSVRHPVLLRLPRKRA
ncbi:Rho guanine nucleotide exchange factor 4/29 [Sarotherodon galilaeus]